MLKMNPALEYDESRFGIPGFAATAEIIDSVLHMILADRRIGFKRSGIVHFLRTRLPHRSSLLVYEKTLGQMYSEIPEC